MNNFHDGKKAGDIIEISPISIKIMSNIVEFCKKSNSNALIIDYGYIKKHYQDSLQTVKNHQYHNIFKDIGNADITAHVDFSSFENILKNQSKLSYKIIFQKDFLINYGYLEREKKLLEKANEKQKKNDKKCT